MCTTPLNQLATFLAERGTRTSVARITSEHVEAFIADLPARERRPK